MIKGSDKNVLDTIYLIPSYERYESLVNLINQINEQNNNCKIIIVNDCSTDIRYDNLPKLFNNIIYFKNENNNGRDNFYITVNKLFELIGNIIAKKYIFLADDHYISKNLNKYVDDLFDKGFKIINLAINAEEKYTNWGFKNWVDGAFAIKHDLFMKLNQPFPNTRKLMPIELIGSGVWKYFTDKLQNLNVNVCFPKQSLIKHLGHTESVMHPNVRTNKPIFSFSFIDENKNPEIYRLELIELLNKKIQIKFSQSVSFFKDKMLKKYNAIEYNNTNDLAVFFGMYLDNDYNSFINHTGPKIIVWCGTDALNVKNKLSWHLKLSNTINIAMSSFVYQSLNSVGIPSEIIPITPTEAIINVKPKGKSIYWYYGSRSRESFYGSDLVNQIKKMTNYSIIEANHLTFNNEELTNVYKDCFLGVRFTEHDGLSNTVLEMGLMGRKCLHNNYSVPNCISYDKNDINSIINEIDKEYSRINILDYDIANDVYNYMLNGNNLNKIFIGFNTNYSEKIIVNSSKKKNAIPNGSVIEKNEPFVIKKPTLPTTNSPIEYDKSKLNNIREGLNKQKQSRITKINDDVFLAKARKRNLKLGGR